MVEAIQSHFGHWISGVWVLLCDTLGAGGLTYRVKNCNNEFISVNTVIGGVYALLAS